MPRFTLSQLFKWTALIAIVLSLTQTEGCGDRYAMIEAISFSFDTSRIAVTKLTCRDAQTPMKGYKANVSRTVSWLDVSNGKSCGLIAQDFKPGNSGPAFELWYVGRTTASCNPSKDYVAMSSFGGGEVTLHSAVENPKVMPFKHPVFNIAFSNSGRFLAASGAGELSVLDTQNDAITMRIQVDDSSFISASQMSFATDDSRIVVTGHSGVNVWDLATSKQLSTVIQGLDPWIHSIAIAPNDSVIVCSRDWVRRYDFAGHVIATLANSGGQLCSVSSDGNTLAVCGESQLAIYDLNSNRRLRTFLIERATALSLSLKGDYLAVGDFNGQVTLIDTSNGARRWCSSPPGRYRLPWTLPAAVLLGWAFAAWRLSRRKKLACPE